MSAKHENLLAGKNETIRALWAAVFIGFGPVMVSMRLDKERARSKHWYCCCLAKAFGKPLDFPWISFPNPETGETLTCFLKKSGRLNELVFRS